MNRARKRADGSTSLSQNSERKRMDEGTHRYGTRDIYPTSEQVKPWPDMSNKAVAIERDGHSERGTRRSIGLLACARAQRAGTILCAGESMRPPHDTQEHSNSRCISGKYLGRIWGRKGIGAEVRQGHCKVWRVAMGKRHTIILSDDTIGIEQHMGQSYRRARQWYVVNCWIYRDTYIVRRAVKGEPKTT